MQRSVSRLSLIFFCAFMIAFSLRRFSLVRICTQPAISTRRGPFQTRFTSSLDVPSARKAHDTNRHAGNVSLELTEAEINLFNMLKQVVVDCKLKTTLRVAGGWVRDRLLNGPAKNDIDIALDNMTGAVFARHWQSWFVAKQERTKQKLAEQQRFSVYLIKQNPERSKHLETVNVKFGDLDIDFVNLRCESYSANSRIPQMHHGTPAEDALRRDLTINALFYNIHTGLVEDFTGRGLSDLQAGVVRTPLPSLVTLLDDPLRAFRLVRFACRFGFAINAEAATACRNSTVHANLAHKVSRERSRDEMFKMLRTSSAVRAVTLLHSFGLLQCLLPMSEELYTNRSSTVMSQRHQGRKVFNLEPLRGSAVIKETFLAQGVCTAQFLGYLHALLETNPVNEQEGGGSRSAQQSRWPLVRKAFQTQREMEDPAIQLWVPALLSAAEGLLVQEETHPGNPLSGQAKKLRVTALSEDLLVKQLKVSHKENLSVCKTLDALVPMRGCLETSIGAAGTAATASAGETPVQANGLTRLALGSAILQAGEHYECALQLVAAQWAVGAALLDCAEKENSKARSAAESLAKMSSVLAALNGIDANGAKCVEAVAGVLPPAAVIAVEAEVVEMYRRAGEQALDGMERLLEAADAMQLRAVWVDNLAPLSGKELKEIFTSLPASSPIYGEMKPAQVEWKLNHPNGADEDLVNHLKDMFKQYL